MNLDSESKVNLAYFIGILFGINLPIITELVFPTWDILTVFLFSIYTLLFALALTFLAISLERRKI